MTEIKELDEKYLVLQWRDIETELSCEQRRHLASIINTIQYERKEHGKPDNKYVVLNLDDEIDIKYLIYRLSQHIPPIKFLEAEAKPHQVKHVAVDLVNAVLKAKEKS